MQLLLPLLGETHPVDQAIDRDDEELARLGALERGRIPLCDLPDPLLLQRLPVRGGLVPVVRVRVLEGDEIDLVGRGALDGEHEVDRLDGRLVEGNDHEQSRDQRGPQEGADEDAAFCPDSPCDETEVRDDAHCVSLASGTPLRLAAHVVRPRGT